MSHDYICDKVNCSYMMEEGRENCKFYREDIEYKREYNLEICPAGEVCGVKPITAAVVVTEPGETTG